MTMERSRCARTNPLARGAAPVAVALWALAGTGLGAAGLEPPEADPAVPGVSEAAEALTVEESVEIRIEALGEGYTPRSVSAAVVEPDQSAATAGSVAEMVEQIGGVARNGQGGLFQVASIRGVSGQRVLSLLGGARLTSERRAGVSASFIDPSLLDEAQVLRGPASIYYGSGALGGAIQLVPRSFERWDVAGGWESQGSERWTRVAWGDAARSVALARRRSDDGETGADEELFDRFEQTSGSAAWSFGSERATSRFALFASLGDDIGKPNTDLPERRTLYPAERHLVARYQWSRGEHWRVRGFVHPQELETLVVSANEEDRLANESLDLGGAVVRASAAGDWSHRIGFDWFGRRDVSAVEVTERVGAPPRTEASLRDAEADEIGLFAVADGASGRLAWEAGARGTEVRRANPAFERSSRRDRTATAFAGLRYGFSDHWSATVNGGRGVRFPSLSELFFAGLTGRGQVVGNPDLREETSTNVDLGIRFTGARTYARLGWFHNEVDDYVERVALGPDLRTFRNVSAGTIEGLEMDGFARWAGPLGSWQVDWSGHRMRGRAADGRFLSDVPAPTLRGGIGLVRGRWTPRVVARWVGRHDEPGPSELLRDSYTLVALSLGVELVDAWSLRVVGRNLFDERYFPTADDQALPARGRSVGLELRWAGGGAGS